jgi:hypothetical protein
MTQKVPYEKANFCLSNGAQTTIAPLSLHWPKPKALLIDKNDATSIILKINTVNPAASVA